MCTDKSYFSNLPLISTCWDGKDTESIGDGVLELTRTQDRLHTPPGLTAYWTPSPSLVAAQYAASDVMRLWLRPPPGV